MPNQYPLCRTILFLGLLTACGEKPAEQPAAAPAAVDSATVTAAVADLWRRYETADTAGDIAALGGMLTDSVRLDLKGMSPMLGRASYTALLTEMLKTNKVTAAAVMPEATTVTSNEMAYQTGDYRETTVTGGKSATEYGRYATAVRKDADGQWRIAYLMAFADSVVPMKKGGAQ